ncbi:MAG: carboxypeptidase regulatory-like domain-containing protein [Pyrinomonadaceae bacterium]
MKIVKLLMFSAFMLAAFIGLGSTASAQNVTVNPGGGSYADLTSAFNAINAGTHTGAVTVDIIGNTTETATATLNASGSGTASYTSVLIAPVGGARTVSGTITGAIIKLNGADNVTIDGRIGGTGRNLTVSNGSTATASAVIWVSSTGVGAGATNNVIRNLEIAGGGTSANALNTYGVIISGPAITQTSAGADNDGNQVLFNQILGVRYGILTRGESATNLNQGTFIDSNIVGPAAFGPQQIGKVGILVQFESIAVITGNTVQSVGGTLATTTAGADRVGIGLGGESWGATPAVTTNIGLIVTGNTIRDIVEERTFSSVGLYLGTTNGGNPTSNLVANNFVYNVRANGTGGDQGVGIGVGGGNGDTVVFNSVSMTGDMDPGTATNAAVHSVGVRIAAAPSNLTFRNNIVYVDVTSNTAMLRHFAIVAPSAAFVWGTGGASNNVYYIGAGNAQMAFGGIGTAVPYTVVPDLATWQTTFTPNQDSGSRVGNPQFIDPTFNLHINPALPSPVSNNGTPIAGVTVDIDGDTRNATTPDIGADEGTFTALPPNDIGAVSINVPVPNSTVQTGTSVTPQATFVNAGTATQTNVSVRFTISGPGGYTYTNNQTIATLAPGDSATVTFAAAPVLASAGSYTMAATVLTADSNAANDNVAGSFSAVEPLNGSYNVGVGGTFTSLTNAGGLFESLNLVGVSGNVTINITTDLLAETGAVFLNQFAGTGTVTIKPSGAARVIESSTNTPVSLIRFNGADNVTIDGSLNGGTDRSLTIRHGSTAGTVIWMASAGAGNGVNNITIKNTVISGKVGFAAIAGILSGSGVTLGLSGEAPHNNNTVTNNEIYRVQNSMYVRGNDTSFDQNWSITKNTFSSNTTADKNSFRGILFGNSQNAIVDDNTVEALQSGPTSTAAMNGIQVAFAVNGGSVSRNRVKDIKNVSATGTGAFGITVSNSSTAANLTIANNFVSDVAAMGSATVTSNGHGINITAGGGYKIYFNSVNLTTNQTNTGTTAALFIGAAVTTAGAIDLRNNILANTQTTGSRFSVFVNTPATNSVFGTINYNNYFSTGNVGSLSGVRATLVDWQTATGQDGLSKAVDPQFVSPTDLHIQPTSPMIAAGTAIAGITTDFDEQTRDAVPEIGADELVGGVTTATISGRITTSTGRGILNAKMTLSGGAGATFRSVLSTSFGYYKFEGVATGQTYTVTINSKRYTFTPNSQQITVNENTTVNFTAVQ